MFNNIINLIRKNFGGNSNYAGSIKKTDSEQAAELGYVIRYEDIAEFNIVSVISGKLANLVCSDASAEVVSEGGDNTRREFLNESMQRCFADINTIAARTFGIGGVVLKPYVYSGKIYTDILPQNRFFVIEQHGEVITKAGFIAEVQEAIPRHAATNVSFIGAFGKNAKEKAEKYTRIEYHSLSDDGIYTIENKIYAGDCDNEREVALSESPWRDKDILPLAKISNVDKMLFSVLKCPTDNRRNLLTGEPRSAYGVPVTYGQDKIIRMILDLFNEIPDEYKNKKTFIGADDLLFDKNNKLPDSGLYRLFRGAGSIDEKSFWEVFSPEIRHTSYFEGLDYLFGLLEKAICLNKGTLTDLDVSNATATAIKRSTLDTFSTVHAMRRNIEYAFDELIYAFGVIANAFDLCGGGDDSADLRNAGYVTDKSVPYRVYRVRFDWDYSLLENTAETWRQLLDGYHAGAVDVEELRNFLFAEKTFKPCNNPLEENTKNKSKTSKDDKKNIDEDEDEDENKDDEDEVKTGDEENIGGGREADNAGETAVLNERRTNKVIVENEDEDGDYIKDGKKVSASKILLPAGRTGIGSDSNPFRKETWNMAEQSVIYRENPMIAKYLASEAKFKM